MSFITQLLPGVRDIRGPLIAGYMWLLAGWLLFANSLPDRHEHPAYEHLFEVGDVLGPAGIAVITSVAAYLVGSLLQTVPRWLAATGELLKSLLRRFYIISGASPVKSLSLDEAEELLDDPRIYSPVEHRWFDADRRTSRALADLVPGRLESCRETLRTSLQQAGEAVRTGATNAGLPEDDLADVAAGVGGIGNPEQGRWLAGQWIAHVGSRESREGIQGGIDLPTFLAARDLFGERSAIQTRLMETTEHAGSEVERLYAESEFRFTVALPLAVVSIVLAAESHDLWWLALLGGVSGLLLHAIVLRRQAGRELIEALRSRPEAIALDQITPVFKRYAENVEGLSKAAREVNWEALGAAAK